MPAIVCRAKIIDGEETTKIYCNIRVVTEQLWSRCSVDFLSLFLFSSFVLCCARAG